MSRRVTTETEIKDSAIAELAFKACGIRASKISDTTFEIRSGRSHGILNLNSGRIEGDSDAFERTDFDTLKQHYAEQKYLWELARTGASIHSRTVDTSGNIIIEYQTTA